jgi:hypothetical protein
MKITAYLWSNPDLPHWQRLLLSPLYIIFLIWCVLIGKHVVVAEYLPVGEFYMHVKDGGRAEPHFHFEETE